MTGGAIFLGILLWHIIKPYQVYLDLWGRYPSKHEADRACFLWNHFENDFTGECKEELETRQYLGIKKDTAGYVAKRFRF